MKDHARQQAVIEILDSIFAAPVPMDKVIGDYMRSRRYIGSKDRKAIVEMTYEIMRHFARLRWLGTQNGLPVSGRNFALTYLAAFQNYSSDQLESLFTGSKHAAAALTQKEKEALVRFEGQSVELFKGAPPATLYECPEDLYPVLKARFDTDFEQEMKAMLKPATLDLRVNIARKSRNEVRQSLDSQGVHTDETPLSPWGLRCWEKVHLAKTTAFKKGWVEIQDEGSQLIALLSAPEPGRQILDYCAGGGGKTLAIASAMKGKGRLVATDIDGKRLARTRPRLKRAGLHDNVEVRSLDEKRHHNWLKRQKNNFDTVLVDAPCSGSGTWRRNPDSRWFRHGPSLDELGEIQAGILEKAAAIVKPGGRLVYATCSILSQENEDRIADFLTTHPEFELLPLASAWLGETDCSDILKQDQLLSLTPARHRTDGFFAAVLERRQAE